MKKNQKILVAVLAIVIVLAVVIFAIAMNKNTNEEVSSTNDVTSVSESVESTEVESSTEVIASIGTAPEDSTSFIDKSSAINFPGSETEASTSESNTVTSNTEVSTSESNTQTSNTKNETSESKTETSVSSTSESSTSESSTSKTETSTSETSTSTEPTTSESSTTTPVDNSSSTPSTPGREITTQGSTGTTSFGTSYAIVSEFNKLGLNPNYDNFFSSDGMTTDFANAFGEGNKAIGEALGYRSNDTPIDCTNSYLACLDAHISRKPESGYYVWVYADNITTDADGGTSARAVHQVMLGAITSTPAEVEAALFEATFGNNSYGLDENGASWTTVGDCKLIWAYGDESQQMYFIKPAN